MNAVPRARIRETNGCDSREEGEYVLYWMSAARRLHWNHALDRAVEHAEALARPLVICETLELDYPWASTRHHRAVLDGMLEHRRALAGTSVAYHAFVERSPGGGRGLLQSLGSRACVVVTDDRPRFLASSPLSVESRSISCLTEAVDGCGLLPLRAAGKRFDSAYHFRRFLQRELPEHLGASPSPDRLGAARLRTAAELPAAAREQWPDASDALLGGEGLESLPIDRTVRPTSWSGGHAPARAALDLFLEKALAQYGEERNHPDAHASSGLSPWLRHGHISAHEVFDAITRREGWSPARLSPRADGSKTGWWGMSPSVEAFLDELVTWRELAYGFCDQVPGFDRYESLPGWALTTLEDHEADRRSYVYSSAQFEGAETHDELWNAAQRQLVSVGTIHPYLRMLWGKGILQWTSHPREALAVMIDLNNRYALDGGDPNSYAGIAWVLGRFDRPWPERPVFGKVRAMTSASARRKLHLERYLAEWGEQAVLPAFAEAP